jgi:hypothetical protein
MNIQPKTLILIGFILFILTAAIFIILKITGSQTIAPEKVPHTISSQFGTLTDRTTLTFEGSPPQLPSTLPIYQTTLSPPQIFAESIAQSLNLSLAPLARSTWIKGSQSLSIIEALQIVQYSNPTTNPERGINPSLALQRAQEFLEGVGLHNAHIDPNRAFFVNDEPENPEVAPPGEASYVIFSYYPTIDTIPLRLSHQTQSATEIWVSASNQVVKAKLTPIPTNLASIGTVELKNFSTILSEIEAGNATIINIHSEEIITPDFNTHYANVTLKRSWLEYRLIDHQVVPYLAFEGIASKQGATDSIEIIVPAYK